MRVCVGGKSSSYAYRNIFNVIHRDGSYSRVAGFVFISLEEV